MRTIIALLRALIGSKPLPRKRRRSYDLSFDRSYRKPQADD